MKDKHSCKHCTASVGTEPTILCYLNPTIRLINYGYLFNSRNGSSYSLEGLQSNVKALAELERDSDYIYSQKYRPFDSAHTMPMGQNLDYYISSMTDTNMPYLEQEDILEQEYITIVNG